MTVAELIEELKEMPLEADVFDKWGEDVSSVSEYDDTDDTKRVFLG